MSENRTTTLSNAPISITPSAALKSFELIQEENNPEIKLRVSILGGGCHGFRYEFSFAESVAEDDTVITVYATSDTEKAHPVHWVVDCLSLQLLYGVEIDYHADLEGERFIIRNLKTKSTCSCGHSFSMPEADAAPTSL